MEEKKSYESPTVADYGDLQELTANNFAPLVTDVPQGTAISLTASGGGDPGMS